MGLGSLIDGAIVVGAFAGHCSATSAGMAVERVGGYWLGQMGAQQNEEVEIAVAEQYHGNGSDGEEAVAGVVEPVGLVDHKWKADGDQIDDAQNPRS